MDIRTAMMIFESAQDDEPWFEGIFNLPMSATENWDEPYGRPNDSGLSVEDLMAQIQGEGQKRPVEVGFSYEGNDGRVFVFDGNHRREALRKLNRPTIRCINFHGDEAEPLTRSQILGLGGSIVSEAPFPRDEFGRPVWIEEG